MPRRIYLDNNATTRLDPRAFEAMTPYFLETFGNASSLHDNGRQARLAMEDARRDVARLLGAKSGEIIFTGGGTEADNLAILGAALAKGKERKQVIISAVEHPAVLGASRELESRGFDVGVLPVGRDGIVSLEKLEEQIGDNTVLISVMHANNETGTLQPVAEISEIARRHDVLVHTDAVQSVGKIPVDVAELGADLLSLSGHKFHGPMGVGALYVRAGIDIKPFMMGGGHERGRRAGTENIPGVVGLGKACRLGAEELAEYSVRMKALRDRLEEGILETIPDTVVNGSRDQRTPHTSNISFWGAPSDSILMALDLEGISVSTGAACHAGDFQASHVLSAMGLDRRTQEGAIRFSLSKMTDERDIETVLEVLPKVVEEIRS